MTKAPRADEPPELPAGEFSPWLRATRRAQRLKTVGNDVPCGTCSACCRSSYFVHVAPDEKAALARIPKALLFPAPGLPKGHVLMGYDANGECPMWAGDRCSIYEDRPRTCRDFDCRVFAATGIAVEEVGARAQIMERVRRWRFDYPGEIDRKERSAVQSAAAFLLEHGDRFPADALPANPVQLAILAIRVYRVFLASSESPEDERPIPTDAEIAKAVVEAMETPGGD